MLLLFLVPIKQVMWYQIRNSVPLYVPPKEIFKFPFILLILGIRFCLILIFVTGWYKFIISENTFYLTHKANIGNKVDLAANINVYQRNWHAHGKFWE